MAHEALLAVFDDRVERFAAELVRCRLAFSDEAVHDLRVSIRRLLALLDLLQQPDFGGLRVRRIRRALKRLLQSLSALRDVQVMCGEGGVPPWLALPGGRQLLAALQAREPALLDEAKAAVANMDDAKWLRRLAKRRKRLVEACGSGSWNVALGRAVELAWEAVWQRHRQVRQGGSLAAIHRERIAFKCFRYTVEIAAECLPGSVQETSLLALRSYQTLLGDLQDAVVLQGTLEKMVRTRHGIGLASLLVYAREQLAARVASYWAGRDRLVQLQTLGQQVGRV